MKKFFIGLSLAIVFLIGFAACCDELRISILGDSYSTYQGWIPKGHWAWYPRSNNANDVKKAEDCWWYLVIKVLNGKLEKNESLSGSTICYTGYQGKDASRTSFVERAYRLGKPDLIFIFGATNDSWANVPIGEYKYENWSKQDLYSFRPAMAKMLFEIKERHPEAKVFFLLNDKLKDVINQSVHNICKYYNIPCIDLKDIDKQSRHPSIKGMKQIADQVIESVKK
ncbi:MAG: hypothetical protein IKD10_05950 [Lentisphaeria bacterium]|nr:hypothetical protein [Lentisphaeria bacterium]MBR7144469.1 hypothetical protein [Lentisphaeria bacterium]